MKKCILLLVAVTSFNFVIAQEAKVVSAINYLRDFDRSNEKESLDKAKESIDLASENEKTKNEAKTMSYRGQIYLRIFDNNHKMAMDKLTTITDPNKRTLTAYQNVSVTELETAYAAYTKAKTLDSKNIYAEDIKSGIARIAMHFENKGIADYNAKKYAEALPSFEKAYEINGVKDTSNLSNCATVAERANNYEKAKAYYQKMIDANVGKSKTYSYLYNVYLAMKDTVGGVAVLTKGRASYPNDVDLLISETNYFLKTNNSEKALSNLNAAIVAKPADANLYLVRGNMSDNMANPKDDKQADLPKPKNYEELLKSAETDYKKAIELKPDYFDALYNLGALYTNHGVNFAKGADAITDQKKYDAEIAKANGEFNKAMPVLEKAHEVNPTDRATMLALKQIYARLQQTDKLNKIVEKLKVSK